MVPFLFAEMIISKYFPHFCIGKENTNRKRRKKREMRWWNDEMNDKSLYWKIMNAKCVEFWKRLFRGHRDKRMKKKNVLLFFESDPPMPSLSHINQHPRFFFCISVPLLRSLSPSTPPLPRLSVTQNKYHLQNTVKKVLLSSNCLGLFLSSDFL